MFDYVAVQLCNCETEKMVDWATVRLCNSAVEQLCDRVAVHDCATIRPCYWRLARTDDLAAFSKA